MSNFDYRLSTITKYRSGSEEDQFIPITESKKIINQQIVLSEIPVRMNGVSIPGMYEAKEIVETGLATNHFFVDYNEGIVHFHSSREGTTIPVAYMGRGNHYVSASRIWTAENNGNVVHTLQDYIDKLPSSDVSTAVVIAAHDADSASKKTADLVLKNNNQNASDINSFLETRGSRHIYFTEGNYYLYDSIRIKNESLIRGAGHRTQFRPVGNTVAFSRYDPNNTLIKCIFRDFRIEGPKMTDPTTQSVGIKVAAQECIFENLWIASCEVGLNLDPGNGSSLMNFINRCYFLDNRRIGMKLGTDSNVSQCMVGSNSIPGVDSIDYDSCGVLLSGWGSRIIGCHLYKNNVHIRGDYAAFGTIQGCQFEAGYREDINLVGRAWNYLISGNMFGGKDPNAANPEEWNGHYSAIRFESISPENGAFRNQISSNSFVQNTDRPDSKYKYCIEESANCNINFIHGNFFTGNYTQADAVAITGTQTVVAANAH